MSFVDFGYTPLSVQFTHKPVQQFKQIQIRLLLGQIYMELIQCYIITAQVIWTDVYHRMVMLLVLFVRFAWFK